MCGEHLDLMTEEVEAPMDLFCFDTFNGIVRGPTSNEFSLGYKLSDSLYYLGFLVCIMLDVVDKIDNDIFHNTTSYGRAVSMR
jgi:hypothetical protein